jgi:hypothetical protein
MVRRYNAYLVRYWCLRNGERRIVVEHCQSDDTIRLASLATALDWIEAHVGKGAPDRSITTTPMEPGTHCNGQPADT